MYPGLHARRDPSRPAQIMAGTGEVTTYAQLDGCSNQLARVLWNAGLRRGDHLALLLENHRRYLEVYWAALRSGLYLTPVNRFLTAPEVAFIVEDCGARLLISSTYLGDVAEQLPALAPNCDTYLMIDGVRPGFESYEQAVEAQPPVPLEDQPLGEIMFYSSGTTGRPKGIKRPLRDLTIDENPGGILAGRFMGVDADAVYLSPAPLYHTASLSFASAVHAIGGTVVLMEHFDAEDSLSAIENHGVTHSQWVPTMFKRLLDLSPDVRSRYDLSTHRSATHGAAPCPVAIKRDIINWWGPIVLEYFGATEGNGMTVIDSTQWLSHEGSVGKAVVGTIHICAEDGAELANGEDGLVYFEMNRVAFTYHNDEAKTAAAQHPEHEMWTTLGDIGHVDDEGYLYLTDRLEFLIISGGVNIYPAESESLLLGHPKVADVAVIGVPNDEYGEEVKAIVEVPTGLDGSDELASELIDFCRGQLAHYKCPRSVDFVAKLPRLPTGKLAKKALRDDYRAMARGGESG